MAGNFGARAKPKPPCRDRVTYLVAVLLPAEQIQRLLIMKSRKQSRRHSSLVAKSLVYKVLDANCDLRFAADDG
jgi:hypothetical protein